ncbi:hypothetical protein N2605_27470 [Bradyrhizobium yuanmingense]|uniref:hypothetical protein n=1 Tax=Bradyrhizobium yuanmingense TaxID=108015 RepID=UPI0021A3FEB2|nr:hypothetical protein [Bradyrhizobium sp. CB1024]UWU83241.1 hypothetical protein N2605_27470 [Bradyrhizobium sp. CB1024]
MHIVKVPLADGNTTEIQVPEGIYKIACSLPYGHRFYFVTDTGEEIPIAKLAQKRARPDGIANAALLMQKAFSGMIPKREPISVTLLENGLFLVLDGNSTVTIARMASWPAVWCKRKP